MTVSSRGVLELVALHTNKCAKSFTLLTSSRVDNGLVKTAAKLESAASVHQRCGCLYGEEHILAWSPISDIQLGRSLGCSEAVSPAE